MAAISAPPSALSQALLASMAPDYQTDMLAAQRRLELAQALQQQAMTDTPGNGGSVSWTQGLARIMDAIASKRTANQGYGQMRTANQELGQSLGGAAGQYVLPGAPSGVPIPQSPQNAPQQPPAQPQSPFVPGAPVPQGQADPLAPLPVAPPQAAPQPPSANPSAPTGGAPTWQPGPFALSGTPADRSAMFLNPDEYGKQVVDNLALGAKPTDTEILMAHARQLAAQGDYQGAAVLQAQANKAGFIPPVSVRPGAPLYDPATHQVIFQAARVGEGQGAEYGTNAQGQIEPTRVFNIPGATHAAAAQAGAISGAQAGAKAPYDVIQVWDPNKNAFVTVPKSSVTGGGGPLTSHYQGAAGGVQSSPSLGAQSAADAYGKGSANAFLDTQAISKESPQRVQALREMSSLIAGPNALTTGPTAAKLQQLAEAHGLPFGYSNSAFVFNKDAARFVAQSASDLGLNGSDARLGMMAHASPNMTMTPQALKVVIPTMIGLEYAKMAKATAAATWAQHDPGGNAQFESTWRQNYDPRMFTAYADGGPAALAKAPANLRNQWLKEYRALRGMGVDFQAFAQ